MKALGRPDIAKICHEANRAYCEALGNHSQVAWEDAPEWQKESAIDGIKPGLSPAQSHENWKKKKKEEEGWVYGPVKDPENKTHPCMVPYEALPQEQRIKDSLFRAIVDTFFPPIPQV